MEAFKLISLFILIYSIIPNTARADILEAKSIASILNEQLAKKSKTVSVISFGKSEEVLEKVLRNKIDSLSVQVSTYSTHQKVELKQPTLLLFDSFDRFVEWNEHLVYQTNARTRHAHLIYIEGATLADIKTLKWGFDGDSTNFLIRKEKSIVLVTGFMFGPSWCGVNQFKVINRFKSSVMKWQGLTFYPEKFRNFYGCDLNIARAGYCGKFSSFFDILASQLNFTLKYFDYPNPIAAMSDPKIDLFCDVGQADETHEAVGAKQVSGTRIYSGEYIVVAPYGELLTALEKMFMPFYFEVWVAIFVTLLLAFIVVQIINRCTQEIQNAFYGCGNNSPTLSLAELFLCGAQRHTPQRSPARFILMMFIIWCLIIRTCYQSELFKYLQSDARKPGVKSVADVVKQNLTLYGSEGLNMFFAYYAQTHGLTSVDWKKHEVNDFDIVAEPENKAVMLYSKHEMTANLNRKLRSGVPSFSLLVDEVIFSFHAEFKYRSGVAFKKDFDRKTTQLLEGGFFARHLANTINNGGMGIKRKAEIIGPQVLTMDHLGIGFIVWLIPLTLSMIVFALEVGKPLCRQGCRELCQHVRDAIVAKSVAHPKEAKPTENKNIKPLKQLEKKRKIVAAKPTPDKRGKQTQQNKKLKHKIIIVKSAEELK